MEDNDIIELYFARNEAAIAETEKKYSGYCGAVARNILNKREDEEECLNDTFRMERHSAKPPEVFPRISRQNNPQPFAEHTSPQGSRKTRRA